MDGISSLREVLQTLPDIYRTGDIERYLDFYATDMTSYFDGKVSNADESKDFIRSLFANGGRTLEFTTGDRSQVIFSESGDAATLCYPWREKFQFGDGSISAIECYQTEVWHCKSGRWKIVHVHLSLLSERRY